MVDQKIENETPEGTHVVESALTALWEKAREASYLISTLRDEKKKLQTRIDEIEEDLLHVKNELLMKQTQLDQLQKEISNGSAQSVVSLTEHEKRDLQAKMRLLISKLDQYLSS